MNSGWSKSVRVVKSHYFPEGSYVSACGKFGRTFPARVEQDGETKGEVCRACARKRKQLEAAL